jgi:hypothetical protein
MTIKEAKTIWLTLLGSDWVTYYDFMNNPQYYSILKAAYVKLKDNDSLDIDYQKEQVKIKCY